MYDNRRGPHMTLTPFKWVSVIILRLACVAFGQGPADDERSAPQLPPSETGQALLGNPLDLQGIEWIRPDSAAQLSFEGHVTLIRWWTDTCPYCAASLPAMSKLSRRYADHGFQTLAVFHPKPPRPVVHQDIIKAAKDRDYHGPLAVDKDWRTLRRIYLEHHPDKPTSVSFLLDKQGLVRYVHPGPVFFPSEDPDHKQADQDFKQIQQAIEILLHEDAPE